MTSQVRKPILISGAGPSSLLLARSLLRSSIPFLVFERDSSLSFRAQGYRLRLSTQGLDAIESVLSPDGFQKFWDTCGKTGGSKGFASINALTGEEIPEVTPQPESQKESPKGVGKEVLTSRDGKTVGISRGEMRSLFLEGCEPFIRFAHHVTGYRLTPTGVHAIFKDGTESIEGEMLIGGDGIYSRIAKQLSQGKLKTYDTGARGIHGKAPSTAFKGLGEGVWRIVDDSKPNGKVFVITNVRPGDMDDPNIDFGWTMGGQPGVIKPPNDDFAIIGRPAAEIAKSLSSNWHARLKPLFDHMDESEAAFWKITCSTPSGVPEWKNEPRVTVIGDAAHSMTPAGGIGANTGVRDSDLLGRLLGEAGGYKDGVTLTYEREMRVYASEAVRASYGMATKQFGVFIDESSPTVGS
ncbi:putative zeaxanthin epoxidase, chloroplastic [Hypoxylon trugodes]|uniref:putative zeaxanthin epoxidase, chloroplastic n=1 Tax=Hypoxylon trugodes TaxID=326681 RepID=UPI00219E3568|nr:putative zeaxanthin epoxidase, chloroplastic [Hypoxylon trugodes]KAI1388158.1 putative zeaxanthin epoxidase, chloroplastic [Hypoxylon trugodes]